MVNLTAKEQKQDETFMEIITPFVAYEILKWNRKVSAFAKHLEEMRPGTDYNTVYGTFVRYKDVNTELREYIRNEAVNFVIAKKLKHGKHGIIG